MPLEDFNYNNNNDGRKLKPIPLPGEDPLGVMGYRYKYVSADKQYYILAFFFIDVNDNNISKVSWSQYRYGWDIGAENMIGLEKDFDNMIDSENWTRELSTDGFYADATIRQ
jgi:hypothetical protein